MHMILVYDITPTMHSIIIVLSYLLFCRISMQICVQNVFVTNFSRLTCYDTISWYDTTLTSLFINYDVTSTFCMHVVHDTSYDTPIVNSLRFPLLPSSCRTHGANGLHDCIYLDEIIDPKTSYMYLLLSTARIGNRATISKAWRYNNRKLNIVLCGVAMYEI
jgi:hypothetical protein